MLEYTLTDADIARVLRAVAGSHPILVSVNDNIKFRVALFNGVAESIERGFYPAGSRIPIILTIKEEGQGVTPDPGSSDPPPST